MCGGGWREGRREGWGKGRGGKGGDGGREGGRGGVREGEGRVGMVGGRKGGRGREGRWMGGREGGAGRVGYGGGGGGGGSGRWFPPSSLTCFCLNPSPAAVCRYVQSLQYIPPLSFLLPVPVLWSDGSWSSSP